MNTDPAPAKPPIIIAPHMLIIISADVPITTPPTSVEFWKTAYIDNNI